MYFRHNLLNLVEYRWGLTFQRLASYTTFGFLVGRTLPSLYAWILVVVLHLHQIHYPVLEHFFSVWIIVNGWLRNHFLDCIFMFYVCYKSKASNLHISWFRLYPFPNHIRRNPVNDILYTEIPNYVSLYRSI